jgi:hypothetical protein
MYKNILLAYAPGSRGFMLGKWLIINGLATPKGNISGRNIQIDGVNDSFTPFYNDALFFPSGTQIFDNVNKLLTNPESSVNDLVKIITTSKDQPLAPASNLIMTHHASESGLEKLGKAFNAHVLRVTFADRDQARDAQIRKSVLEGWITDVAEEFLEKEYFPFIRNFSYSIDITMDQVNNLELDFLKSKLA